MNDLQPEAMYTGIRTQDNVYTYGLHTHVYVGYIKTISFYIVYQIWASSFDIGSFPIVVVLVGNLDISITTVGVNMTLGGSGRISN